MINNAKTIPSDQSSLLLIEDTQPTKTVESEIQNESEANQYIQELRLNSNIDPFSNAAYCKKLLEYPIPSSWSAYSDQIKYALRETDYTVIMRIFDSLEDNSIPMNFCIYGVWVSVGNLLIGEEVKQKLILLLDKYIDELQLESTIHTQDILSILFTYLNQAQVNRLRQNINNIPIDASTEVIEKYLIDTLIDLESLKGNSYLSFLQKISLQKACQEHLAKRVKTSYADDRQIDTILSIGLATVSPVNWRNCLAGIINLLPSDTFQKLIQPALGVACTCENIEQAEALFTYADILYETYGCIYGSLLLKSLLPDAPEKLSQAYKSIMISHDSKITLKNAISQSLNRNHQALNNQSLHTNEWDKTFREMQISQLLGLLNDKSASIDSGPIEIYHEKIDPNTITSDELSTTFKTLYTSEYEVTRLDKLVRELLNGLLYFPFKNRKEVILSIHSTLRGTNRVQFLERIMHLYPDIENYFIVNTHTWSRITTSQGVQEILKFSPKFACEKKIGFRTLFELQGINWQDQIEKGQTLFITQIANHCVTLCALNKQLTGKENCFLILDSIADECYVKKIRAQLPQNALILTNTPPIGTPNRSVYERQKDLSNCSYFALKDAKTLMNNPQLIERMWKEQTPTSDANRLLISIQNMPWQFHLSNQSVKNVRKFAESLSESDKKIFSEKLEKHLFWSHDKEKYLNSRIDCFARKQEKTLLNLALGED